MDWVRRIVETKYEGQKGIRKPRGLGHFWFGKRVFLGILKGRFHFLIPILNLGKALPFTIGQGGPKLPWILRKRGLGREFKKVGGLGIKGWEGRGNLRERTFQLWGGAKKPRVNSFKNCGVWVKGWAG